MLQPSTGSRCRRSVRSWWKGLALKLPPLVCPAFNADFDGDQMAVHLPLSDAAQQEAREIMSAGRNLLKPATGDLITAPINDVVLGLYYITRMAGDKGAAPSLRQLSMKRCSRTSST